MKDLFGDPAHVMTGSHTMIIETNLARHLQMVIPELKLTKKVTADEEGTVLKLPSIVVKKPREVERRRFYLLSTDIEARGHMESCPGYALLTSQREATGFRERIGMTISAGEARMETYKNRIAERERVRQRKRARVERGAGDVLGEPGDKYDELVAVRHADASGGYIYKTNTKRKEKETSKSMKEDQKQQMKNKWTNGGRWYDLSTKLRTHQHLPIHMLLWSIMRVVRHNVGRGPYLCRSQVMLMTTYKFLRWMPSTRKIAERVVTSEKSWIGIEEKMQEISKQVN